MKLLIRYSSYLSLICTLACSSTEYMVESDYSYDARFHRYKSFKFASNSNFKGSEADKDLFEKYVGTVLSAWGYRPRDKKPDLYVFVTIYYEDLTLKGYQQPNLKQWSGLTGKYQDQIHQFDSVASEQSVDDSFLSNRKLEEEYNAVDFDMREGTILISFFDRKKGKTVWQGYASGVFGADKVKNKRTLRSAIINIMDEFKLPSYES